MGIRTGGDSIIMWDKGKGGNQVMYIQCPCSISSTVVAKLIRPTGPLPNVRTTRMQHTATTVRINDTVRKEETLHIELALNAIFQQMKIIVHFHLQFIRMIMVMT